MKLNQKELQAYFYLSKRIGREKSKSWTFVKDGTSNPSWGIFFKFIPKAGITTCIESILVYTKISSIYVIHKNRANGGFWTDEIKNSRDGFFNHDNDFKYHSINGFGKS